jgi:hypothetical protein
MVWNWVLTRMEQGTAMGYPTKRVTVVNVLVKGTQPRSSIYRSWSDDSQDMSIWMHMRPSD